MYFYIILVKKQVKKMVYYEIKKVFSKTSSKIAVLLLIILLGSEISTDIQNVPYTNEEGNQEYGISAIRKLKEQKKQWTGEMTEEKLMQAIEENARIQASPEAQSRDIGQQNIAYHRKQALNDIRDMIADSWTLFREWDYYTMDYLKPEDAKRFYSNRTESLKEYLASSSEDVVSRYLSEKKKAFLLKRYEELETPLKYDTFTGWDETAYSAPILIMIMCLILGFLVAGIFSGETRLKADSVFFSAYHGRKKAVLAKLLAGFIIVTGFYWLIMLLYSAIVLGIFGTDGADCMIQISLGYWKSFYNITFLQRHLLILFGGYIGTLFVLLVTMLVSAKTKSAVLAVMVPFIVLFGPTFLSDRNGYLLNQILGLWPDKLMKLREPLRVFNLVEIGGTVTGSLNVLFVLYAALSVILVPVIYQVYRRTAVK
ncbi:MAG: ABC transporter permease [Bacteroidales bacterium]|nr:ABC transporter permease [Clostridium sp.]MCM1203883.1 ABC transporter permease [Bacteroidales bacterium]